MNAYSRLDFRSSRSLFVLLVFVFVFVVFVFVVICLFVCLFLCLFVFRFCSPGTLSSGFVLLINRSFGFMIIPGASISSLFIALRIRFRFRLVVGAVGRCCAGSGRASG